MTPILKKAFDSTDEIMLVSHSLGTMISYDNLWKFSHYGEYRRKYGSKRKVDTFVTLGSPLGDENVKKRLKGGRNKSMQKYPLNINHWINLAAEDDFISHDSKLADDFKDMHKLGILAGKIKDVKGVYNLNVRKGVSNPHSSIGYLINPKFTEVLWKWMSS